VLYYMLKQSAETTIEELVRHLAIREADSTDDVTDPAMREQLTTALVHCHLPKLAAANVVSYSRASGRVELQDLQDVEHFIDGAAHADGVDLARTGE
jgi:hypothetical protein